MMFWLIWILPVLLLILLGLIGFMGYTYYQIRKRQPHPAFKPATHHPDPRTWSDQEVTFTWVGHSTLYINFYGFKILTDPVFSERVGVSIGNWVIGPKRHTGPALLIEEVQDVDLILLSHAHLDHFDLPSLRGLAKDSVQVIVPLNTSRLLNRMKFGQVREMDNQDSLTLANGVQVTAVPVRHWGNRFPWNKDYGYQGYVIEYKGTRLFFAGDTAYTPTFASLRAAGDIDIAFMPIGAYSPDAYQRSHCTPEQAWQMCLECGAKQVAPIHWDTFVLSNEPVEEPMRRLLEASGSEQERVIIREHGDVYRLPAPAHVSSNAFK